MFEENTAGSPLQIVAVGASAGGLEALEALFAPMPLDTGMAFVVIQHLSPDFESRMDELLSRRTYIPVRQVRDGEVVQPDTIYLSTPGKEMIVSDGRLLLTDKDPNQGFSLPIDGFLRSLARDAGPRGVAVILSGTGSDGSRGVKEVQQAGGLVICQDPETARFDGMPRSAIDTGAVDLILPPEAVSRALVDPGTRLRAGRPTADPKPASADGLDEVFRLLRAEYGIDFAHYKPTTVTRRIDRRLAMGTNASIEAYAATLRERPEELNALYLDLLIGVTRFFRDRGAFEALEEHVIPALVDTALPDGEIRVWVPGCATGEEAYSLAILIHERLRRIDARPTVRVFATDVHSRSLEIAGLGIYDADKLKDVSEERVQRYFEERDDGRYQVRKELRDLLVFARQNLISDAPFTRLDLISCRNLLIYFQPAAQKKVIALFHFALKGNGALLLGPSETPGPLSDEFQALDNHWKLYRKRRDIRLPLVNRLALRPRRLPSARHEAALGAVTVGRAPAGRQLITLYDRLLSRFLPAGWLVDESYQLIHTFGQAERFTKLRPGRVSTSILDLVPRELKASLAAALQHCRKEQKPVRYRSVDVALGDEPRSVRLSVEPLPDERSGTLDFLITVEELQERVSAPQPEVTELNAQVVAHDYVSSLEAELRFTQENLQATIEELETSNEELQATNEELVAANEELQSTNEELHSVNEELYSVNAEHQRQIVELRELTDDLDHLLQNIDLGVIFLDEQLCVRKLTRRVGELFPLIPQDPGRRFGSFAHEIAMPDLVERVEAVLREGVPFEREVRTREGRFLFLRILPYRAGDQVSGVVLTLIDIGTLKQAEAKVRRLSAIVESSTDAIVGTDLRGRIVSWNSGAAALYGYTAEEALERRADFIVPEDRRAELDDTLERVRAGVSIDSFETVRLRRDGQEIDVSATISPIRDDSARLVGASIISRDITRRKHAEREVRRAVRQRDQFLALLSHELRNPLMGLLTACQLLRTEGATDQARVRACAVIERQTGQMARLLDDMLDASRRRRDKIEMRMKRVDLRSTLDAVLDAVRSPAAEAEIDLEAEVSPDPLWVDGDPARLQQLTINLVINAIKYTPSGKKVRLVMDAHGDHARLKVVDEGIGIPADLHEEIFEPFHQADEPLRGGGHGMGLGLALVESIARAHGGTVAVKSEGRNRGSTFTVQLRLASPPDEAAADAPPSSAPLRRRQRVLVVEDGIDNRELLSEALELQGYEVVTAVNGQQALAILGAGNLNIAIVDIGLPDMSGLDVARRAREMNRDGLRLIALTGHGRQKDRDNVLAAGFDEHLVKPVALELLEQVMAPPSS